MANLNIKTFDVIIIKKKNQRSINAIWYFYGLCTERDLILISITFFACLFLPLEYGVLIGIASNVGFILYSSAKPKISIQVHKVRVNLLDSEYSRRGIYYYYFLFFSLSLSVTLSRTATESNTCCWLRTDFWYSRQWNTHGRRSPNTVSHSASRWSSTVPRCSRRIIRRRTYLNIFFLNRFDLIFISFFFFWRTGVRHDVARLYEKRTILIFVQSKAQRVQSV